MPVLGYGPTKPIQLLNLKLQGHLLSHGFAALACYGPTCGFTRMPPSSPCNPVPTALLRSSHQAFHVNASLHVHQAPSSHLTLVQSPSSGLHAHDTANDLNPAENTAQA